MERGSITKWLLLGLAVFFLVTQWGSFFGSKAPARQPLTGIHDDLVQKERAEPQTCKLEGPRFRAELSTLGASLRHFQLTDRRFDTDGKPMDLVTTKVESRLPLRTDLRAPLGDPAKAQVAYDDLDWKLAEQTKDACVFTYVEPGKTELKKTVSVTGKPYELAVEVTVKNLGPEPKTHRFAIEETSWQTKADVEGGFMKRQTEHISETVTVGSKVERHSPSDFEPGEFKKPEFTAEKWRLTPGPGQVAAVSSVYFTKLVAAKQGEGAPAVESQIEIWPDVGYLYRARLAYPERTLATGETVTYKALTFGGPKEHDLLASIGPGAAEVLNLGMFATIARGLLWYLHLLYGLVKSWGVAIMLLTITVRMVLFPLSISQIKNSMAMRKLKPEMDALNEQYKDDAAQRGLAIQELWRKNGVSNPVVGCLPLLLQMPVWWALYTALQTATELYHVPFLWFPDLTAYDKYYIIPFVLGASSFLQQKLMPAQGDPQQQKMMLYMMPAIFLFMMLFLPAGLGVYMLTNSLLAIGQQLLVEKYLASHAPPVIEVRDKTSGGDGKTPPALGKGKQRARG